MFRHELESLIKQKKLVDFRRDALGADDVRGFPRQLSADRVLVSSVSDDILPDGFAILRLQDIRFLRWDKGNLKAWQASLAAAGPQVESPSVDLSTWATIIRDVTAKESLVTFHRESGSSSVCYIGLHPCVEGGVVQAEEVTPEGEVDGHFALLLEDLTRLEFGGSYERGLGRVLAARG